MMAATALQTKSPERTKAHTKREALEHILARADSTIRRALLSMDSQYTNRMCKKPHTVSPSIMGISNVSIELQCQTQCGNLSTRSWVMLPEHSTNVQRSSFSMLHRLGAPPPKSTESLLLGGGPKPCRFSACRLLNK